jgi:hypothetical protein
LGEYCRWLARREEETAGRLREAHELLHQAQQEVAELRRQHQELAVTLDRILHGNTWRLRTLVHRLLRGGRDVIGRASTAIRGRA